MRGISLMAVTLGAPNESRLSCGATLRYSQMEFYHTARKTFSGSLGTGAASFKRWLGCAPQVIARVRPRQELRAALTVAYLPWNCEAEWTAARDSPRGPRPKRNGTFIWKALRIEPNHPDGCRPQTRSRPGGCSQKDLLWGELRS